MAISAVHMGVKYPRGNMKAFFESLTPLVVVQALLSIIVVVTFCYQEVTIHSVDTDLKLITFGVVGFWLGGIIGARTQLMKPGVKSNDEQSTIQ